MDGKQPPNSSNPEANINPNPNPSNEDRTERIQRSQSTEPTTFEQQFNSGHQENSIFPNSNKQNLTKSFDSYLHNLWTKLPPKEVHNISELIQSLNQIDDSKLRNSRTPKLLNDVTDYIDKRLEVLRDRVNVTRFFWENSAGIFEAGYFFINSTFNRNQFTIHLSKLSSYRKRQVFLLACFLQNKLHTEDFDLLEDVLLSINKDIEQIRSPQRLQ